MRKLIDLAKPHTLDAFGNPAPAAMREIADAMERLHRMDVRLDFSSPIWSVSRPSGTPVCHSGAFALAAGMPREHHLCQEAGDALARHLGFVVVNPRQPEPRPIFTYVQWAKENIILWGNRHGADMFCGGRAFSPAGEFATLMDIANHYRGVAHRLESLRH